MINLAPKVNMGPIDDLPHTDYSPLRQGSSPVVVYYVCELLGAEIPR
jgi:hypothetical protein